MTLQGPPLTGLNVPNTKKGPRRLLPSIAFGICQRCFCFKVLKLEIAELCYLRKCQRKDMNVGDGLPWRSRVAEVYFKFSGQVPFLILLDKNGSSGDRAAMPCIWLIPVQFGYQTDFSLLFGGLCGLPALLSLATHQSYNLLTSVSFYGMRSLRSLLALKLYEFMIGIEVLRQE